MKTLKNVTPRKLDQLRMLGDRQLTEMGYDVTEVTAACLAADEKAGR